MRRKKVKSKIVLIKERIVKVSWNEEKIYKNLWII